MHKFEKLDWDSAFFHCEVGKVSIDHLLEIGDLKTCPYDVTYVYSSVRQSKLEASGVSLMDEKITLEKDIQPIPTTEIESFQGSPTAGLEALAIQSGGMSRFKKDPKLNPDFPRLYRQWIHNLCAPEGKGQTLVCRTGEQLNGMVALDQDDAVAQVVLVAVAEGSRGQGLGKRLMQGAEHWGYIQGLKRMQVVTQQENIAALRLYEKSGYAVTNRSYIYHFWK